MRDRDYSFSRRSILRQALAAGSSAALGPIIPAPAFYRNRPRVAAIFTEFRFRSHAFNILENFVAPYLFNGRLTDPGVEVVSFFADQFPEADMAREVSRRFGIPLFGSIDEALCVGGRELAVDAVLSIVEHGEYPTNARGQKMYPRKEFFDAAVAVMRRSGRSVPVFNDKHLSYRWDWSREMYCTAMELGVPFMAGSSVPLAERRPAIEIAPHSEIADAVSIHGGGVEVYDFHALEVLQSFVESRRGGETGVACVEFLEGDALWQAAERGRWSLELAEVAMAAELGTAGATGPFIARPGSNEPPASTSAHTLLHGILLTYSDGFRATVLQVGRSSNRWNFACRFGHTANIAARDPKTRFCATAIYNGPWGNRCLFKGLSHAIQHLFTRRCAPYPVERTLLVSGILDAAMFSRERRRPIETPHLQFTYQAADWRAFREYGDSWKVITTNTPELKAFEPGDARYLRPAQ